MNILVTGSRGQLGSELQALSVRYPQHNFFFYDLPELDITNSEQINHIGSVHHIEVIINAAAYTAVDKAESDTETAFRVNSDGAALLATYAKEHGALLLHISTDYVFDGTSSIPYKESDKATPLGVYGRSKWEGEERIRAINPSHLIIRTSWLYSMYGANFIKTMLRLGSERSEVRVVFDQVGTPTWAADLAEALLSTLSSIEKGKHYNATYHYSNEGVASWYDVASAVMEMSNLSCKVLPIESCDYPVPAPRPHYSVFNKAAIKNDWNLSIPHWRSSLAAMLHTMETSHHS